LFQRLLALHHPGAGTLAKLLHHSSRNRGHCSVRLRVFETRSAVVSGPGPGPAVRARNVSSLQEKRCRAAGRAALQRSDALSDPGVSGLPALRFALFRRFLTRTQRGDHFRTRATLATRPLALATIVGTLLLRQPALGRVRRGLDLVGTTPRVRRQLATRLRDRARDRARDR